MVLFNPLGNLLLLGGFGNLRGNMEVWDVSGKKKAAQFEAPDTTDVRLITFKPYQTSRDMLMHTKWNIFRSSGARMDST